jgi:hypothetical protein
MEMCEFFGVHLVLQFVIRARSYGLNSLTGGLRKM